MKLIYLTQGKASLVDDDVYEKIGNLKWCAIRCSKSENFYAYKRINNKNVSMHQYILGSPGGITDHINGDTLDNRKENLRIVTVQQNAFNRKKRKGNSSSSYKGVGKYATGKTEYWIASVYKNGELFHISHHDTEEGAALKYNEQALIAFGEYARINVINLPRKELSETARNLASG